MSDDSSQPNSDENEAEQLDSSLAPEGQSLNDAEEAATQGNDSDDSDDGGDDEDDGDSLADRESDAGDESDKLGRGFTGKAKQGFLKSSKFMQSTSTKIVGFSAGMGIGFGVLLLFLFMASLKVPNLTENITKYAMAGLIHEAAVSDRRVVSESLGIQSLGDKAYDALKSKYGNLRAKTWGRMDGYRPGKIAKNLSQKPAFEAKNGFSSGGRVVVKGFTVEGKYIEVKPVTGIPNHIPVLRSVLKVTNETRAYGEVISALKNTPGIGDRGIYMRSQAMKELRSNYGLSTTAWKLADYKNLPSKLKELNSKVKEGGGVKAFTKGELRRMFDAKGRYATVSTAVSTVPAGSAAVTQGLQETADKVKSATQASIESPEQLRDMVNNNSPSEEALKALEEGSAKYESTFSKIAGFINGFYGIALPLCLIYDGSMVNAGSVIDTRVHSLMQTYSDLAAKGDKQKEGLAKGEDYQSMNDAIAGTADSLGEVTKSNAYLRASGLAIDDTQSTAPQANLMQTYDHSMITTIGKFTPAGVMAPQLIGVLDSIVSGACKELTSMKFIIGGGLLSIASAFFTAGGSTAAEAAISTAGKNLLTRQIKIMVNNMILKQLAKKGLETLEYKQLSRWGKVMFAGRAAGSSAKTFGKNTVVFGAKIAALTYVARLIVSQSANVEFDGLAQDIDLANQADMGGKLLANESSRTVNGGRALTEKEATDIQEVNLAFIADEERQKPAFNRYLSLADTGSLLSRLTTRAKMNVSPKNYTQNIASVGNVLNPLKQLGSTLMNHQTAYAEEDKVAYEYGIVPFGWSADELALLEDEDYGVNENARVLEQSGKEEEIQKKYDKCFSQETSLGTILTKDEYTSRDESGGIVRSGGDCSPSSLSYKNPTYGDLVFRYRATHYLYAASLDRMEDLQAGPEDGETTESSAKSFACSGGILSSITCKTGLVQARGLTQ